MYWTQRQKQLNKALEKNEKKLRRRLKAVYKAEAVRLASQIDAYYAQYGVDNVLTYRVMKQALTPAERNLLMRDIDAFKRLHPEVNTGISFSSYKIERLEALQAQVLLQAAELGLVEQEAVKAHLTNMAALGADTLNKSFNVNRADIIQRVVGAKWSGGENFSDRIWNNRQKLAREVNTRLAQGFARGDSRDKLVKGLQRVFTDVSRSNIERLVYTEGTYVMAEAQAAALEGDFTYYKLSPAGDGQVCELCEAVAAETENYPVRFEDREPGINFPPLHPWCRCSVDVVIPDRMEFMRQYTDRARAEELLSEVGYED